MSCRVRSCQVVSCHSVLCGFLSLPKACEWMRICMYNINTDDGSAREDGARQTETKCGELGVKAC